MKYKYGTTLAIVLFAGCASHTFNLRLPASDNVNGCTAFTDEISQAQLDAIVPTLADEPHRLWHYFWHTTRNGWSDLSTEEQDVFIQMSPNWKVPHLMSAPAGGDQNDPKFDPQKNGAGEDFLYMHHHMIQMVRSLLVKANQPCISSWSSITAASSSPTWQVQSETSGPKSDSALQQLETWEKTMRDPQWLKSHSLSSLGYTLEVTLHNNMHMRWADDAPPSGFASRPEIPDDGQLPDSWNYEDPKYDWLADTYSAHVNIHFWKLHGYVDDFINSWLSANGYSEISEKCLGRTGCYEWQGTWVGNMPAMQPMAQIKTSRKTASNHHHQRINGLREAGTKHGRALVQRVLHYMDLHHSRHNKGILTADVLKKLKARGHKVDPSDFAREFVTRETKPNKP